MDYIPILLFFANSEFMVFLWMHGFHQHVRIYCQSRVTHVTARNHRSRSPKKSRKPKRKLSSENFDMFTGSTKSIKVSIKIYINDHELLSRKSTQQIDRTLIFTYPLMQGFSMF